MPFYSGDPNSVAEISVENLQAILDADSDNLYFTLDTANMLQNNGPIMFPVQGGDNDDVSDKTRADDFVETYNNNETDMLAYTQTLFTDVLASAPDRVLWGTDTAFTWHTRPAVYRRQPLNKHQLARRNFVWNNLLQAG